MSNGSPYPLPFETGLVDEIQTGFLRGLRSPRAGYAIIAGKETRVGHIGIETLNWREASTLGGVQVSQDFPAVHQVPSGTTSKNSLDIPMYTADYTLQGRQWRSIRESGLDMVAIEEMGRNIADELNAIIWNGVSAGNFGPTVGLLNNANTVAQTVSGGNWDTGGAVQMNKDIAGGLRKLYTQRVYGNATLVLNPSDSDLFQAFVGTLPTRYINELNTGISRVLWDDNIAATTAALVTDQPGFFDWVSPRDEDGFSFGLGSAILDASGNPGTRVSTDAGPRPGMNVLTEDHPLINGRTFRWFTIGAPRLVRGYGATKPSGVVLIDFSR